MGNNLEKELRKEMEMEEKTKYLLYEKQHMYSIYDDNIKVDSIINATKKEMLNLVNILNKEAGVDLFVYGKVPKEFHSCSDYHNWRNQNGK